MIRLYQPDEQLEERMPEGVNSLANFIQTLMNIFGNILPLKNYVVLLSGVKG